MSDQIGDAVDETESAIPEASDGRVELPRGHWVIVKDPWTITEAQRVAMLAENAGLLGGNRAARRKNAGREGTVPKAEVDEEDPAAEFLANASAGKALVVPFIEAWGGPLLDGQPVTQETLEALPAPLYVAIDEATTPAMRQLFPRAKKGEQGDPTEP